VFLSIVYFKLAKWQRLVQLNSALLSCSRIVISILTFFKEIYKLIKMMMVMMIHADSGTMQLEYNLPNTGINCYKRSAMPPLLTVSRTD